MKHGSYTITIEIKSPLAMGFASISLPMRVPSKNK
jgi:hypothetical protein